VINSVRLKKRAKGTGIRCVNQMKLSFILMLITQCFRLPAFLKKKKSGLKRTLSYYLKINNKL
jgi:hypothetical protein